MQLLGIGSNGYGQLSLGHCDDAHTATRCLLSEGKDKFEPLDITYVTGGGNHTAIVTKSGDLYLCGQNSDGQLGLPVETTEVSVYRKYPSSHKWKSVACGWNHTLGLTADGSVFSFGNNAFLQLGVHKDKSTSQVEKVLELPKIKQISCGLRHSLALTEDGQVYGWGANRYGQTGQPSEKTSAIKKIEGLRGVTKVDCGQYHSVVLTESSQVYVFGLNKHGLLGVAPQELGTSFVPIEVKFPTLQDAGIPIVDLSSGWNHITVLDQQGNLHTWGRNDHFQLGIENTDESQGKRVREFRCGSEHSIALCEDDECFTWGWNEHGNCGTGDLANVSVPTRLLHVRHIRQVACGYGQTFVIAEHV
ncbi:RCC1/BLIP-II protein [Basidiobolus meristosporus CBS 931.73]|uniref:RCC1/BLIP-II protein n=1 Tax=Basidiobolus meristosporus CBS 931.73 TaxID=1314790 RepID=A0A1Y1ZCW1_9FUNG|nr:RCC1/BLIP-II protein [Basidiobolus meristosporus CBS 931.73]|eukprot:ORY08101.1 RCC1/BLIP-II protein [Basidiobolus meristosporus CBS 931.73]